MTANTPLIPAANVERPQLPVFLNMPLSTVGGCIAWLFAHPFELVKNRVMFAQTARAPSVFSVTSEILAQEGASGLFNGLSAGIARQLVYATLRLGLYQPILDGITGGKTATKVGPGERIVAGATSGAFAAFCSCPVEVALVRMTKSKEALNLLPTLTGIAKNEGVLAFWKGSTPLLWRAAIVGVSQVAFYDQVKATFKVMGLNKKMSPNQNNLLASTITGIFYSTVTMPIEAARVRMMATQTKVQYGMCRGIMNLYKEGGVRYCYRGFVPYCGRCMVHTIALLMIIDTTKHMMGYR